jgi:uncharacterized protein with GYD domain
MPGFVVLYKFTEQGLKKIKDMPDHIKRGKEESERMGIRVVGTWVTMGEYDIVAIVDAPDEKTVAARLLETASAGNVTTTTMRALSEDEFREVIGRLP